MSDAILLPRDARHLLSASVVRLLRGGDGAPSAEVLPSRREVEERARAGEPEAAFTLRVMDLMDGLATRVRTALAQESVEVIVADGSRMSLDEAERLLTIREERGAYRMLRGSIDDALRPFRRFRSHRTDAGPLAFREALRSFLVETQPLRDAARDALAVLGGEPLEDAASLARALDLPHEDGLFGEEETRALITAARDAAQPPVPVGRFRAPRAMAGVALEVLREKPAPTFAWPPSLRRFDRHVRTVEGCCTALAWAHGSDSGRAVALALGSAPCRRAIGTDRSNAERVARIGTATAVLRARAAVALAMVATGEASVHGEHEARDAVADALGVDPGPALLSILAASSWVEVEDTAEASAWMTAPDRVLVLRELFDETWPLRTEAWHELASLEQDQFAPTPAPAPASERERTPDGDRDRKPESNAAAQAWTAWASEWL